MHHTLGIEIIQVTVANGYSHEYIDFETNLTRLLNHKFPRYHLGGDIYQSCSNPNVFFITALYNTGICDAKELDIVLEKYVEAQYKAYFPHVISRNVTTDQDENKLIDHCYNNFL